MNLKQKITTIITQFFIIYGCITIMMAVTRSLGGEKSMSYEYLFYIMAFSMLGALPSLIMMIHTNVSEKAMKIRWCIHFIILEAVIISAAFVIKEIHNVAQAAVLFTEVAIIYVVVRLLEWENDRKTSKEINEGLKRRKLSNK